MIRFAAIPPPTASRIAAGSAPSFEPSTSASASPPKITATSTWLQAFAICPAPAAPTWVTREPSTSKTGRARSTAGGLAADHDRERPLAGADVATGDRRVEEVDAARRRRPASSRASAGETVLMSTTSEPGRAAAIAPSGPPSTSRTAASSLTIEITTSASAATAAGPSAARAPASPAPPAAPALRFQATTS